MCLICHRSPALYEEVESLFPGMKISIQIAGTLISFLMSQLFSIKSGTVQGGVNIKEKHIVLIA